MRIRTTQERKAYVDGFAYCQKQFSEALKKKSKEEAIEVMKERVDVLIKALEEGNDGRTVEEVV